MVQSAKNFHPVHHQKTKLSPGNCGVRSPIGQTKEAAVRCTKTTKPRSYVLLVYIIIRKGKERKNPIQNCRSTGSSFSFPDARRFVVAWSRSIISSLAKRKELVWPPIACSCPSQDPSNWRLRGGLETWITMPTDCLQFLSLVRLESGSRIRRILVDLRREMGAPRRSIGVQQQRKESESYLSSSASRPIWLAPN